MVDRIAAMLLTAKVQPNQQNDDRIFVQRKAGKFLRHTHMHARKEAHAIHVTGKYRKKQKEYKLVNYVIINLK